MIQLLAMCVTLAIAAPAFAEDKPKPNTLTPTEISDGWILLFDGETFGWAPHAYKDGKKPEIAAKDGRLIVSGSDGAARFTTPFGYFELTGEYRTVGKGTYLMVVFRGLGEGDEYNSGDELVPSDGEGWLKLHLRSVQGEFSVATREGKGTSIRGTALVNVPPAHIRFGLSNKDGGRIELRNLKLRPLETKPLFTGKNLDGWKVNAADPKRMASKFEVTKDGELSVKNGPGDLVTEKEFDNFVLQFECKTLGKALNSGIFFRCIPGQYQNGYEAQIQNAYQGRRPHQAGRLRHRRDLPPHPGAQGREQRQRVVHDDRGRRRQAHRDVGERLPDGGLDRRPQGERQPAAGLSRREGAALHPGPRPDDGPALPQHPHRGTTGREEAIKPRRPG